MAVSSPRSSHARRWRSPAPRPDPRTHRGALDWLGAQGPLVVILLASVIATLVVALVRGIAG